MSPSTDAPPRREGYPPGNRAHWPGTPLTHTLSRPHRRPPQRLSDQGRRLQRLVPPSSASTMTNGGAWWRSWVPPVGRPTKNSPPYRAAWDAQEELDRNIEEWTQTLEKYELMEKCQAAGVRAMPVQSSENRVDHDPQLRHREYVPGVGPPGAGQAQVPECALQAVGNPRGQCPLRPPHRRTQSGNRRGPAGNRPRRICRGIRGLHLLAGVPDPLPVHGRHDCDCDSPDSNDRHDSHRPKSRPSEESGKSQFRQGRLRRRPGTARPR